MGTEQEMPKTAGLATVWICLVCCLLAMPDSGRAQATKLRMSEAEAARLLASDDLRDRDRALLAATELGDRAGPELRAAVLRAAWEELRGETGRHSESEAYITYILAVAELRDPAAIPFLVEHGGASLANDLADFGELAFPAVLERAADRRQPYVWDSIETLRFMVEDGWAGSDELTQIRQVVHMRLTEPNQNRLAVASAATLAIVLGYPELVAIVERLASDRSSVVALLSDDHSDVGVARVQQWARDRLAGVPLKGGFVRRPPK